MEKEKESKEKIIMRTHSQKNIPSLQTKTVNYNNTIFMLFLLNF